MGGVGIGVVVIGGVLALVGVIVYMAWLYERKRTKEIEAVAQQMGLSFAAVGDPRLPERIREFSVFNQGHGRRAFNLVYGETDEVSIYLFDYQYTVGSGKNSQTHRITVAALDSKQLNVPWFTMRPEGFFDRFGALLGLQDINFTDHAEFSRRFVLKGPSEEAIRHCFRPGVLDFFVAMGRVSVEAMPERMIFYRGGQRAKPADFPKLLEEAYRVFGVLVD